VVKKTRDGRFCSATILVEEQDDSEQIPAMVNFRAGLDGARTRDYGGSGLRMFRFCIWWAGQAYTTNLTGPTSVAEFPSDSKD
jgi:hypothetical protein